MVGNKVLFLCRCKCGTGKYVRYDALISGHSKSCGCCMGVNLLGKRFIRLEVISFAHRKRNTRYWNCRCDCGKFTVVDTFNLTSGNTKSCGCYSREICLEKSITHGMSKTRFYRIWCGMKNRCLNSNIPIYKYYGARGVSVCEDWLIFENFKRDMYESYCESVENRGVKNTTLDRVDCYGNYSKENCRWVDMKTQNNNRRDNIANMQMLHSF